MQLKIEKEAKCLVVHWHTRFEFFRDSIIIIISLSLIFRTSSLSICGPLENFLNF